MAGFQTSTEAICSCAVASPATMSAKSRHRRAIDRSRCISLVYSTRGDQVKRSRHAFVKRLQRTRDIEGYEASCGGASGAGSIITPAATARNEARLPPAIQPRACGGACSSGVRLKDLDLPNFHTPTASRTEAASILAPPATRGIPCPLRRRTRSIRSKPKLPFPSGPPTASGRTARSTGSRTASTGACTSRRSASSSRASRRRRSRSSSAPSGCACSGSPAATTATSRTRPSRRAVRSSSCSRCSAPARRRRARSGGRRCTASTTASRTARATCTRRSAASTTRTRAGSSTSSGRRPAST